jgi:peptidoglycan/LPS O-acetylase OafA/YrhL
MVLGTRGGVRADEGAPAAAGSPDRPAASRSAPHEPAASRGLRHEPALDGLRGLAVAVVVLFHLGRLTGGFLGVDLFFVLSGFLITSLLVAEHGERGTIALGRFWARRARRLLPALFLVLVAVALLIRTLTPAGERPTFRGDALATLGYVANWHALADDAGYWDMFIQPSPLDHMWSLAIEEQFYVVWPLVVVGLLALARRRRWAATTVVAVTSLTGAVASFVVLAAVYSPLDTNRAYYGTDSRVGPTLLGAALAALSAGRMRARAEREVPPGRAAGVPVLGIAALAVMGWAVVAIDGIGPAYYRGGLVAFSVAAVVLVHAVTGAGAGVVGRALSTRPLTSLGLISYGVYLWHWPAIVYLTPERTHLSGWALDGVRVGLTLVAAVASYVLVERPIRRGALRGPAVRVGLVGAVATTTAAVLATTAGVARVPGTDVAMASEGGAVGVYPETIPAGARRILLVGDSGPTYLGPALAARAARSGAVAASDSQPFCTILEPDGVTRWADGSVDGDGPCHDVRRGAWSDLVERFDPDVVVYYLAAGGGAAEVLMDGRWVRECDPGYDRYLADALRSDADLLGAQGATVALATTPAGPFVLAGQDVVDALDCRRATFDAVVEARPGTEVVDMAGLVGDASAAPDASLFRDPVHLSDKGADVVADWLVPTAVELID